MYYSITQEAAMYTKLTLNIDQNDYKKATIKVYTPSQYLKIKKMRKIGKGNSA
jgi:ribosomal protein L11